MPVTYWPWAVDQVESETSSGNSLPSLRRPASSTSGRRAGARRPPDHSRSAARRDRAISGGHEAMRAALPRIVAAAVAEDRLGPRVPGHDTAGPVGGDDGVVRRLGDGPEALLAGRQGRVGCDARLRAGPQPPELIEQIAEEDHRDQVQQEPEHLGPRLDLLACRRTASCSASARPAIGDRDDPASSASTCGNTSTIERPWAASAAGVRESRALVRAGSRARPAAPAPARRFGRLHEPQHGLGQGGDVPAERGSAAQLRAECLPGVGEVRGGVPQQRIVGLEVLHQGQLLPGWHPPSAST